MATCRLCGSELRETLVDLGSSPPCESFLRADQLNEAEPFYPLHVWICGNCLLAQLEEYVAPEDIFKDYAYFSAYSSSWVEHALRYTEKMIELFGLGSESLVVELASNDGYLLQHFIERGVPSLGIDPAANVAEEAEARGVETLVAFFDSQLAETLVAERGKADLIVANNVLAQVPGLNDFVAGIATLLADDGVATIEVPHLVRLIEEVQFDTIYHEHYSYFSLTTLVRLCERHGLEIFHVEELPSHGGSLRIYVTHASDATHARDASVPELLDRERAAGYTELETYRSFGERVHEVRWSLLELLIRLRREGKRVIGYGAPGKGNTLLNFCGIRSDLIELHGRPESAQAREVPARNAHPDLSSRHDRRDPPGLHRDPALEPPARDRRPARAHARLGCAADRADPGAGGTALAREGGGCLMKVVIFCGGLGLRMGETSARIPKPMIPIGDKPILWHIMNYYASFGVTDFVLCLGYKSEAVKEYFLTYNEALANDFVLSDGGKRVELLKRDIHNWSITFVNTGLHAVIGERLKKVQSYLDDDDIFLATYGDGLTDAPLPEMVESLKASDNVGVFLASRPTYNFHVVEFDETRKATAVEDVTTLDLWINAGFFAFRREFFDYVEEGEDLVEEPFRRLIDEGKLAAFPYDGFWAPMDTLKDKHRLETLYESGQAPWRTPVGAPNGAAGAPVPHST